MPKDTDNDDNPDLLNALESIKGLLEQSESKLSAARESLKKAKSPEIKQGVTRTPVSDEPVVPVLEDVVETGTDATEDELPLLLDDVPVLETRFEPDEEILSEPPQALQSTGHSTDKILAYIEQLQLQLEKELSETLMRTAIDIEAELRKTLNKEIKKFKEQLTQSDND